MVEDKNMVIEEAEEEYLELDKEHPDQGVIAPVKSKITAALWEASCAALAASPTPCSTVA